MTANDGLALDTTPSGIAFWIHVSPRSKRARVGGTHGDALRVAVTAPAVEGKANAACARILAEALSLRSRDVVLDSGSRGRRKRVEAAGDPQTLRDRLLSLARNP